MKTYDEKILWKIVMQLSDEGIDVSNVVHIGNNVFEMEYSDIQFLSGTCGKAQYTVENGEVKLIKRQVTGMA